MEFIFSLLIEDVNKYLFLPTVPFDSLASIVITDSLNEHYRAVCERDRRRFLKSQLKKRDVVDFQLLSLSLSRRLSVSRNAGVNAIAQ